MQRCSCCGSAGRGRDWLRAAWRTMCWRAGRQAGPGWCVSVGVFTVVTNLATWAEAGGCSRGRVSTVSCRPSRVFVQLSLLYLAGGYSATPLRRYVAASPGTEQNSPAVGRQPDSSPAQSHGTRRAHASRRHRRASAHVWPWSCSCCCSCCWLQLLLLFDLLCPEPRAQSPKSTAHRPLSTDNPPPTAPLAMLLQPPQPPSSL